MSLSKIFSSSEIFEPEEIVQSKFEEMPITIRRARRSEQKRQPEEDAASTATNKPEQDEAKRNPPVKPGTADNATTAAESEPTPPPPEPEQEPPPPPGVPPETVEQMVAEAYENGVQAGLDQAEQDFGSATRSLLAMGKQLNEVRETILKNSIGEIQDLTLAIAEKIIRHSIRNRDDTILATVEEAIHKAVKSDAFDIYVNPEDYEAVAAKAPDLVAEINGLSNLAVKKDGDLERGGCRVESDNCIVDASLVSQLEIIGKAVKQPK